MPAVTVDNPLTLPRVPVTDPLLKFRDEFPILERCTYLVSNSLGAMPRAVPERLAAYADAWRTEGVRAWAKGWWEMPVTVGVFVSPGTRATTPSSFSWSPRRCPAPAAQSAWTR